MGRPDDAERRAEHSRRSMAVGTLGAWTASFVLHATAVALAVRFGALPEPPIGDGRPAGGAGEVEFEITVRAARAGESPQPESVSQSDTAPPDDVADAANATQQQPIDARAIARALTDAWSRAKEQLARVELAPSTDPGVGGSLPVPDATKESAEPALAQQPVAPAEATDVARDARAASRALPTSSGSADESSRSRDSEAKSVGATKDAAGGSAGDGSSSATEPGFGGHAGLVLTFGPRPEYPPISVRLGEEGHTLCALTIRSDGVVERIEVIASSGHARLDEAAKKALKRWRFRAPVPGAGTSGLRIQHRVTFRLE